MKITKRLIWYAQNLIIHGLYLVNALGISNGPTILNDVCSELFANSSKGMTARNLDMMDIYEAICLQNKVNMGSSEFIDLVNKWNKSFTGRLLWDRRLWKRRFYLGKNLYSELL